MLGLDNYVTVLNIMYHHEKLCRKNTDAVKLFVAQCTALRVISRGGGGEQTAVALAFVHVNYKDTVNACP